MKIIKPLIIAASLFASCTLFYSSSNNARKVDIPPTRPARVLTEEQQEYHVKKTYDSKAWNDFSKKAASSVKKYKELHDKSIDEKGYGVFYGSSSKYVNYIKMFGVTPYQSVLMEKMLSDDNFYTNRRESEDLESIALKQVLGEKTPSDFRQPIKTDCLEWCLLNMRRAYKESDMSQDWKNITETAVEKSNNTSLSKNYGFKGVVGTELAKVLINDRWVALYYNPDTIIPKDKPAVIPPKEEVKKLDLRFLWFDYFVKWTEHIGSYKIAKEKKHYYNIPIIDMIVDYNPTTELDDIRFFGTIVSVESPTVKKTGKVEKLKQIPFGLLLARGGQHDAIISYGKVYEVHHASGPVDKKLIDVKDFETEWDWLSGVILLPPGAWQK